LHEFDNNTFTYTPKSFEDEDGNKIKNKTESIKEKNSNRNLNDEKKESKDKEYKLANVVEKFLDSIVADDTSNGIGTDNMTCIIVRFKK